MWSNTWTVSTGSSQLGRKRWGIPAKIKTEKSLLIAVISSTSRNTNSMVSKVSNLKPANFHTPGILDVWCIFFENISQEIFFIVKRGNLKNVVEYGNKFYAKDILCYY